MATETTEPTDGFGQVSRIRGLVFENVTRAASAVGVVALLLLLVYTTLDAFQPFTADPGWYVVLFATFVVPALAAAGYCWRHRDVATVALRATGALLAGTALAAILVLWLGGQLALATFVAAVLPTGALVAYLTRERRALTVGLQAVAIAFVGGGLGSTGAFFVGPQATLVAVVALGVPAAFLARYFLSHPAAGTVGVRATGYALIALGVVALLVEAATGLVGLSLGDAAVGLYALAPLAAVGAYAVPAVLRGREGLAGLFAPFILLAGGLVGYLFHSQYVVAAPLTPLLYGVTVGVPVLAFAASILRNDAEGRTGLALPVVPAAGAALALAFHARYVVLAPNALATFALALGTAWTAYAWYVTDRGRPGAAGLAVPLLVGAGLAAGLLGAEWLGFAGPDTWLDVDFLTNGSHYQPELSGIHPALVGSLYLMFVVTFVAFPLGVGAAIYLEEYAPQNRWARFLEVNIANLAGVPSVVYGLLGVAVFIRYGGLELGAVLAGGFTLSLLILPIVIISAQEAIRAVPDSLRRASYGMGATRWQTVRNVVLPRALPGILTGTILSLGRAVGETAPLLMVGLAPIGGVPDSLAGQGTAMPLQVFAWAMDARELFRENVAAAGSMTLLVLLLTMNAAAIIIRNKYQREQ